jgi:choline dehydrogenase-like flavoprotein
MSITHHTEIVIIGSGAGGALTAATLAEAGRDVTVLEEGPWVDIDACTPFSSAEMAAKYRYGGPNAALGRPPITFVEGRCVGGGTEINAGLYHRPPPHLVDSWARAWGIIDLDPVELQQHAKVIEDAMSVSLVPDKIPESSEVLARGARSLGWDAIEVPRLYRYEGHSPPVAIKQSMTRTMIPRAVAAGARVFAGCRAIRLRRRGQRVVAVECRRDDGSRDGERFVIASDHVFV